MKKFYIINCVTNKEYNLIKKKLEATDDQCIKLNNKKSELYEKLVNLKASLYFIERKNCKIIEMIIPDLYVWCYYDKLKIEYDKLKTELTKLFTSYVMRSIFIEFENVIILEKGDDKQLLTVESIDMFKNFKYFMLSGLNIDVSKNLTKFIYTEKIEYREYDIGFIKYLTDVFAQKPNKLIVTSRELKKITKEKRLKK